MKKAQLSIEDASTQRAIQFIYQWVKKYSFLFIKYSNWSISVTHYNKESEALDFSISYFTGNKATAQSVKDHFVAKGMKVEPNSDNGLYVHIRKKNRL